jgi:hypothetical protein
MRSSTTRRKIEDFMDGLGRAAKGPGSVFLTGGATAVLFGWRESTLDVDFKFDPEPPGIFESIPRLKNELDINMELVAPSDFVPALLGWRERCRFIAKRGSVDFYHFDFYTQALSKIERSHTRDLGDVRLMVEEGLVEPARLRELFLEAQPALARYPAIDPEGLRKRVDEWAREG